MGEGANRGRFSHLGRGRPSMIVILRLDQTVLYLSPFAEQLTGHTAKELLGSKFFRAFAPDPTRQESFSKELKNVLSGTPLHGFESPIICKDGLRRWMVWNAEFLADYEDAARHAGDRTGHHFPEEGPGTSSSIRTLGRHRPDDDRPGSRERQRPRTQPGLPGDAEL